MIKTPVKLNEDTSIVDADGHVIALMCWLTDLNHVRKQEKIGRYIVDLINSSQEVREGLKTAVPVEIEASGKVSVSERMKDYWRKRRELKEVTA